mmetsp:Transcript_63574/g.151648  ORF Transcript_63574/g.151648 Transcript_63574/m.151648 type:complete len:203 (+) Transcript_63574:482-1090(+)
MLLLMFASSIRSSLLSKPSTRGAFFSSSSLINVLMCMRARVLSSSPDSCASTMFNCRTVKRGIGLSASFRAFLIFAFTSLISLLLPRMSSMTPRAAPIRLSTALETAFATDVAAAFSSLPSCTWSSIMSSGVKRPRFSSTILTTSSCDSFEAVANSSDKIDASISLSSTPATDETSRTAIRRVLRPCEALAAFLASGCCPPT